jgi:Vps52 / Sac2 family
VLYCVCVCVCVSNTHIHCIRTAAHCICYTVHIHCTHTAHNVALKQGGANDGSSLDVAPADTATAREVRPHLEKLRAKACARSREYLLARISELRRPKTNVQVSALHPLCVCVAKV